MRASSKADILKTTCVDQVISDQNKVELFRVLLAVLNCESLKSQRQLNKNAL